MKTKNVLIPFCLTLFFLLFVNNPGLCGNINPGPKKGGTLPAVSLPMPKNPDEKLYVGLVRDGSFKIHQIKAEVVLIKIFSLYCSICQSTTSAMVELYHQIGNHPESTEKIKLIGIGAGNSQSEVEVFKQDNNVPFPLFPDEDITIHKALGEVRTPFFIAIKMNQDRSQRDRSHPPGSPHGHPGVTGFDV